ncbi:large subunit ribosomal protein L25 [Cerasibacillus quisquiliarum]|uniref:Large ribosomal subunit protein bL25 n=1 Tax=Cerasibacillus quisquiliarum TaxID=227865 RepID=A0A511UZY3_9BACI|nr:50S ribosomal protein L25/general stress protein Ctc [Cerasibacillus quisquiliarum]MBB5146579.1 large subunit ribosomal protein L25 [Cerasibacillus quisquiliarum]GEN31278.1 general stress protein CTC [Cerasibacillus quisquiliarum]
MATLKAVKRDDHRSSVTKQLRKEGLVPGVVYGKKYGNESVAINGVELLKLLREEGRNAIISLEIGEEKPVEVMLHDHQMDAIRNELLHVDFFAVDMDEEIDVEVPIAIVGDPVGARDGGILQQPVFELVVRAKPNKIPDEITVDVSSLEIGDVITVADLKTTDEYSIFEDEDMTIATVLPPESEDVEEREVDLDAEPELIGAEEEEEA